MPKTPTLAQEITAALREWHKISKKLFVSGDSWKVKDSKDVYSVPELSTAVDPDAQTFLMLKEMIFELHGSRKKVMSSNLTVEGLRELKKQVARIIDTGNKYVTQVTLYFQMSVHRNKSV